MNHFISPDCVSKSELTCQYVDFIIFLKVLSNILIDKKENIDNDFCVFLNCVSTWPLNFFIKTLEKKYFVSISQSSALDLQYEGIP